MIIGKWGEMLRNFKVEESKRRLSSTMEDLLPINSTPCADLERLAAAAATMGYSSDTLTLPSHQIVTSNVSVVENHNNVATNSLPSAIVPQYTSDPYDLSRPQQYTTIRFAEFQPKAVFEPNRSTHVINQQQIITTPQNHQNARLGTHYTVIERTDSNNLIPRGQGFTQQVIATKNMNVSEGTSNIHYLPVDVRNISNGPETLAIAVSQAPGIHLANSTQINPQPVIHFVQQPTQQLSIAPPHPHQEQHLPQQLHHHHQRQPPPQLQQQQQQHTQSQQQLPHSHQQHPQSQHSQPQQLPQSQQQSLQQQQQTEPQSGAQLPKASTNDSEMVLENSQKKKTIKKAKQRKADISNEEVEEYETENGEKNSIEIVPEPVEISGEKYYVCSICDEKFLKKYLFKRHQIFHTGEKRGALSLETKAKIIKRIKSGEKQVDLAMEYNVGRSTLSFIMKNADKFLGVLKNGKFHPDSKRLRGAQREDVEAALYEWYKQASQVGMAISGPILCRKARDFAAKLGYQEFKATHGWLDRFKRRKHIVLGRTKSLKEKDTEEETEEFKEDFADIILPNIMIEYESNDVFHASEIGLLYRILPSKASQFKGTRCAGGTNSKKRITVLMCTNMTGSEKFPLLVIGKHSKPKCFRNVKSLPVQYLSNEKSWMTKENFSAWLTDLNSWFVQQNRKILLVVPNLPIHPKSPKLSAVKVIVSPSNFVGPSKLGIAHALKRNYRRAILESLLRHMDENSKIRKKNKKLPLKLSLLSCLHKLAAAWHAVTDVTIGNSFQRSALGKYGLWSMNLLSEATLGTENLDLLHRLKAFGAKVPNSFTFDDYITFDDEVQVCHFMDDDDIIASVTGADIESSDSDDDVREEINLVEPTEENKENAEDEEHHGPPFPEVERNLGILRNHISHQAKGSQEMFGILSHLEYLLHRTIEIVCIDGTSGNAKEG